MGEQKAGAVREERVDPDTEHKQVSVS